MSMVAITRRGTQVHLTSCSAQQHLAGEIAELESEVRITARPWRNMLDHGKRIHGLQWYISDEECNWLWKQQGRGGGEKKAGDTSKAEDGKNGDGEVRNGIWKKECKKE